MGVTPAWVIALRASFQVSWDWRLESTIVFRAVSYLDNYLMQHNIAELGK